MVGAGAVAGLASDGRFRKSILIQIGTHGMTPAAFFYPGTLVPASLAVIGPCIVPGVILYRCDIKLAVLFNQKPLFPLDADGVFYLLDFGDIDLIQRNLKLLFQLLKICPDGFRIDFGDYGIPILSHILKGAAVKGCLPGIVMFQVADFALFGADKRLWTGHDFLDLVLFWTATNQSGGK